VSAGTQPGEFMSRRVVESGAGSARVAVNLSSPAALVLLVVSWAVTRAVLFAQTFSGQVPTDVLAYARWAGDAAVGTAPAADTAFVYPPGAVALFVAIDTIPADAYFRTFTLVAALADLLILVLLWWVVRGATNKQQLAPWVWVGMGFAAGPLMYERYDIFAAMFAVLAVLSLRKPVITGVWAGVGLIVKLWPEIALLGVARRHLARALAVNLGVIVGLWAVLELVWGNSLNFIANVLNKGMSVEAVAAYPFLLMRSAGTEHGVTGQYGSWEVIGPGVESAATATTVVGVVLLLGIFILRVLGRLEAAVPGDVVLFGVLIFVATHKINSLQYGVWIAAIAAAALTFPSSRAMGPAVLLTLMLLVADQVIWDNFVPFISGNPLFLGYQGLRLLLLLAATVWIGWTVLSSAFRPSDGRNSAPSVPSDF